MPKKIWRKNFAVSRCGYQLGVESSESCYKFQAFTAGKNYLTKCIWIQEKGDGIGTYFIKDELRGLVDATMDAIINKTDKVVALHKKTTEYNQIYFSELKKIEKMDLPKLTTPKLASLYNNLYKWLEPSHGYSLPTTWFVDSDNEDLTNYLLNFVKDKVEKGKSKLVYADSFSVLTTPEREGFYQKEQKESLEILNLIKSDSVAKKIFFEKNTKAIEKDLSKINKALRDKILKHYQRWRWAPYTYFGPAYDLDYYLEIWSSLLRQKIDIKKELHLLARKPALLRAERRKIFKILNIDQQYRKIFNEAAEIVRLKAYRKDVLYYGCYITDMILKELGKRYGFSMMQMRHIAPSEMKHINKLTTDELNQRIKFSVIYVNKDKTKILTGRKAKAFLDRQFFEKVTIEDVSELKGTPACVGRVKGAVKVINYPEEMGKMKVGDIMVSHATFPALVPAMKKAAAIVTDDGGLTCHAAIVARELKKPCVVGTKIATRVLKDGDMVEVDANKGIVRKL